MKTSVTPLCDHHQKPMQFARLGSIGNPFGLQLEMYQCAVGYCSRVYQHGQGYIDFADAINFENRERRQCPEDLMTMYLSKVEENGIQVWRCGQVHCDYFEKVNPYERFPVTVKPIAGDSSSSPGDQPYAQMEAVGIFTQERWIGPSLPWHSTVNALSAFGQNAWQVGKIRESLLSGRPAELAGPMAPLALTERHLRKAGLKRPSPVSATVLGPMFL